MSQVGDVGSRDTGPTELETQARLAELQRRAEVAEALAAERAEQITDLRRTLAMLTAGPTPPSTMSNGVPPSAAQFIPDPPRCTQTRPYSPGR